MGQQRGSPLRAHRSTTPPRRLASCHGLSSTWTAAMGAMSSASRSCAERDVAQADLLDEAALLERGQRAHARGQRRARIWRVELIEVDALDAERAPARLTGGGQVTGASVGNPAPARPREATLGRHAHPRGVAAPGRERTCDQALVVPDLARVPAVGIRGVDQGDAGVEGGVQRGQRARLVTVGRGGQAHRSHGERGTTTRHVRPSPIAHWGDRFASCAAALFVLRSPLHHEADRHLGAARSS